MQDYSSPCLPEDMPPAVSRVAAHLQPHAEHEVEAEGVRGVEARQLGFVNQDGGQPRLVESGYGCGVRSTLHFVHHAGCDGQLLEHCAAPVLQTWGRHGAGLVRAARLGVGYSHDYFVKCILDSITFFQVALHIIKYTV